MTAVDAQELKRLADDAAKAEKARFECERYIGCCEDGPSEQADLRRLTGIANKAREDFHAAIDRLTSAQQSQTRLLSECQDAIQWCAQECGHKEAAGLAVRIDAALDRLTVQQPNSLQGDPARSSAEAPAFSTSEQRSLDAVDAARYRWLRKNVQWQEGIRPVLLSTSGPELDTAIDAAIAGVKP